MRVIVVGAGMAGLIAARSLINLGHDVTVVDKSRGPGGRMSTRRRGSCQFDHGAQYFTARDAGFREEICNWVEDGLVQNWNSRIGVIANDEINASQDGPERFVAVPGMNAVCRALAGTLSDVRLQWTVNSVRREAGSWVAESLDGDLLTGDVLLLAIPPEQARILLQGLDLHPAMNSVEMLPAWCLMVELDKPLLADFDAAFINEGDLSWVASQACLPARPSMHAWVVHASPAWSGIHLEDEPDRVVSSMLEAVRALPGASQFLVHHAQVHRWRYALAREALQEGVLWNYDLRLAVAGDWCNGSRVEGAYLSGLCAAEKIHANPLEK